MTRFLTACALLLLPFMAQAQVTGGSATVVRGEATLERQGQNMTFRAGMALRPADKLNTAPGTRIQLIFPDDTVLTVGGNSTLVLESFALGGANTKGQLELRLIKGTVRALPGQLGSQKQARLLIGEAIVTLAADALIDHTPNGQTTIAQQDCCLSIATPQQEISLNTPGQTVDINGTAIQNSRPLSAGTAEAFSLALGEAVEAFTQETTATAGDPAPPESTNIPQTEEEALPAKGGSSGSKSKSATAHGGGQAQTSVRVGATVSEQMRMDFLSSDEAGLELSSQNFSGDEIMCIYHSNASAYRIFAYGSGAGGSFAFTNGEQTIPYTLTWEGGPDHQDKRSILPSKTSNFFQKALTFDTKCTGENSNARLRIRIPQRLQQTFKNGNFKGTLVVLMEGK